MKDTPNYFDLEQMILACWTLVDELDTVASAVEDGNQDEIMNMLVGLKAIYSRKFENLFLAYEAVMKSQPRRSDQVKQAKSVEPFGY